MFLFYFNIFLTYFVVGLSVAIYFYYILRRKILGNFWGALVVGLIGSFLGGFIDQFFADVIRKLSDFNSVNLFASVLTAMLLIWIFTKVSSSR